MAFKNHFQLMAHYNHRLNTQIFSVAMELGHVALEKSSGAFFGCVIGTLNHIFVGDILWISRFTQITTYHYHRLNTIQYQPH